MDEVTGGGPVSAGAEAAAGATETARYEQDLSRSIGILGNVFITLSGVTPASAPDGTGPGPARSTAG
jgi:hypothetical protein